MSVMSMIERAARALHRRRVKGQHPKPDNHPWEALSRREQALLRADAYAVIAAIREPSDAMKAAGIETDTACPVGDPFALWHVMIDAALVE